MRVGSRLLAPLEPARVDILLPSRGPCAVNSWFSFLAHRETEGSVGKDIASLWLPVPHLLVFFKGKILSFINNDNTRYGRQKAKKGFRFSLPGGFFFFF